MGIKQKTAIFIDMELTPDDILYLLKSDVGLCMSSSSPDDEYFPALNLIANIRVEKTHQYGCYLCGKEDTEDEFVECGACHKIICKDHQSIRSDQEFCSICIKLLELSDKISSLQKF